jgi:hypothetical protein
MHPQRGRRLSFTDLLGLIASLGLVFGLTVATLSSVGLSARSGAASVVAKIQP